MMLGLPDWLFWLIAALILLYLMVAWGLILGKTGVEPMWAVLPAVALLLPVWNLPLIVVTLLILLPAMIWRFAYCVWPAARAPSENPASPPSGTAD